MSVTNKTIINFLFLEKLLCLFIAPFSMQVLFLVFSKPELAEMVTQGDMRLQDICFEIGERRVPDSQNQIKFLK